MAPFLQALWLGSIAWLACGDRRWMRVSHTIGVTGPTRCGAASERPERRSAPLASRSAAWGGETVADALYMGVCDET